MVVVWVIDLVPAYRSDGQTRVSGAGGAIVIRQSGQEEIFHIESDGLLCADATKVPARSRK